MFNRLKGFWSVLVVCCLAGFVFAAPHWGEIFELKQADGTLVKVKVWGDEFYQRVESLDGYSLIRDRGTGWICYAELSDDGEEFVSTGVIYRGEAGAQSLKKGGYRGKLKKGLKLNRSARVRKAGKRRRELLGEQVGVEPADGTSADGAGIDAGELPAPAPLNGSLIGLTILIDFPDQIGTISPSAVDDFCNLPGYSGYSNNGSVRDYFSDISGGQLDYTNVVVGYYRAKNNKSYYDNCDGGKAGELIGEALRWLDDQNPAFDFNELSLSGNRIMALNVFYAGNRSCGWADGLWPHKGWYSGFTSKSGVRSGDYQITDIGSNLRLGTFCHENGHMICKWPDLYDYGYESSGVGRFCLMASSGSTNPIPPNAYFRDLKGWDTVIDITDDPAGMVRDHVANSLTSFRYSHPTNSKELFMIESRLKTGRNSGLADAGLLIWHIDADGSNNNEQMTSSQHYKVSVEQADGAFHLENGQGSGGSNDLYHVGNKVDFNDETLPDARWWNGAESGLDIHVLTGVEATMSFVNDSSAVALLIRPGDVQEFSGLQGGPFAVSSVDFTIRNLGSSSVSWTLSNTSNWLSVPSSGVVSGNQTKTITVELTSEAALLGVGTHRDMLIFTDTVNGTTYERDVRLVIKPRQMVGYWKLDETSGYIAADSSGNDKAAFLESMSFDLRGVDGVFGGGLRFNGLGDYVRFEGICSEVAGTSMTVAMWIKSENHHANQFFASFNTSDGGNRLLFGQPALINTLMVFDNDWQDTGVVVFDNSWHHVAFVLSEASSELSVYVDGDAVFSYATEALIDVDDLFSLGQEYDVGLSRGDFYEGMLDDVRVYNYALTSDEIGALLQGGGAENPVPYDGSEGYGSTSLSWGGGAAATSYEVYLGKSEDGVANATKSSDEYKGATDEPYYFPETIKLFSDYFWRVDCVTAGGTIAGNVWRFRTGDYKGSITREVWTGISGNNISGMTDSSDYPGSPDEREEITSFEGPTDWADDYGTRIHGFLVPEVSGNYTFWISGDDYCELWLSSDEYPSNAEMIAEVPGWSSSRQWDKFSQQKSSVAGLVAGKNYYIKALHKEGGGGDNIAVAWQGPGVSMDVIAGSYLMPYFEGYVWAPQFGSDPIVISDALEGYSYSGTVSGEAEPLIGTTVIYSRAAGGRWLDVEADGSLSGVPGDLDTGVNYFTVRATDEVGNWADATLEVTVENTFTGELGIFDLAGLADGWLESGCVDVPACGGADLTGDSSVDADDIMKFAEMWLVDYSSRLLVSHLPFDVDGSDVAGDNDAVLFNGARIVKGAGDFKIGAGAIEFDGINDYATVNGVVSYVAGIDSTIAMWVKADKASNNMFFAAFNTANGDDNRLLFGQRGSSSILSLYDNGWQISGAEVFDGTWHHLAFVVSDSTDEVLIYVDGELVHSYATETSIVGSDVFSLGQEYDAGLEPGDFFGGKLDDVMVYDRGLSGDEVRLLWQR